MTVAAVWTVSNLVQVADPQRVVPTYVNLIMAGVVGWFFGSWIGERRKRNGGDDDAP